MNLGNIKQLWQLITLYTITTIVTANPSEHFLNTVISQLKQSQNSQFPLFTSYQYLYDELFGTNSQPAKEFQNPEAQESSENSLHQLNLELDQSQTQIFQQLDTLQHQANFVTGNPLNSANNDELIQQQQKQPAIIGLQQFNVNGYLNLPPPEASAGVTSPSQNIALQNTGPNMFAPNNDLHPASIAVATFDPQFLIQNLPNLQNNEQPNETLQNNQVPVPTYYFYNPDSEMANENFIDDPYNIALKPLEGEQLLGVPPGKKIVVEPLFVAMAGFVGVAMIFMSAILFLPKILSPPPEVSSLKGPQELAALTKLAVETIEGNDCTERIACEVGRAMRNMQVGSKPIKVLEVLLPANLAKQLAQIRKAVANKKTCRLIQCKRVKPTELKSKTVESKMVADVITMDLTTKVPDKRHKGKTEIPLTSTKLLRNQSTTIPEKNPNNKKEHKEVEKKLMKEQQDSKAAQLKDRQKPGQKKTVKRN